MVDVGIMLEGQEGLTWERWFRLATTIETLGFDSLFRSDHLKPLEVDEGRETLALWPSLTALALRTRRLRFGPLVCPITFRQPSMVAKMAVSVSNLSNGRLDLGLGAGWNAAEHRMFGINYPKYATRLDMLDEGTQLIRQLWSGEAATFRGRHYGLDRAMSVAPPATIPIIMGGKGKKTLQLVARHADEWNCSYAGVEVFRAKSAELDENCRHLGRDPATLRRSIMIPFVIGEEERMVQRRIDAHRAMFPSLRADLASWREAGFIGGTPNEIVEQISRLTESGAERFMLQHNDLDDIDSLELLAQKVLPHLRSQSLN